MGSLRITEALQERGKLQEGTLEHGLGTAAGTLQALGPSASLELLLSGNVGWERFIQQAVPRKRGNFNYLQTFLAAEKGEVIQFSESTYPCAGRKGTRAKRSIRNYRNESRKLTGVSHTQLGQGQGYK